jgi:DUF1680 family protein
VSAADVRGGEAAGPTAPTATSRAVLATLAYDAVRLDESGMLGGWQELNRTATIDHCIAQLDTAGNLENLRRVAGESDGPFRGYWFADSDIYKVLEAVGWEPAGDWGGFLTATTELMRAAQGDDGYLNSWIQGEHPERRWQGLEESHELYCLGHMIQAAVAVSRGRGDDGLLTIAREFADLVSRDVPDKVDGHPEIESALVELYRHTGEREYLEAASRMVENRGRGVLPRHHFGAQYLQDHLPVRDATEAIGHAVRQLYLAAGVTDVYLETGDETLLTAMEELWRSTFEEKTYVTGAHGSRHRDEAFGDPYELPPDRAYAETCAAIASFLWNWRLLLATGQGRYAEEMERALYNAIAVSTALDGRHFFYSNPLHLRAGHDGSTEDAPSERLSWYACACCPPNLARLVASLHHYVATGDGAGVQLHLLAPGRITAGGTTLEIKTDYPWDGRAEITLDRATDLAIRIPAWAAGARITADGETRAAEPDGKGYVHLDGATSVVLELPMEVRAVTAHPRVDAVRDCVAFTRGPIVYCIEQADHEGVALEDLRVDPADPPQPAGPDDALGVPVTLEGRATVANTAGELYRRWREPAEGGEHTLRAIPYFRWANRGPNPMRVWIPISRGGES